MLMFIKRPRIVQLEDLAVWGFWCVVLGAALGAAAMHHLYDKHHVPEQALQVAREQVDKEMQAACSNWFTDKKARALPEGRIVVCRAPKFMSIPPQLADKK